MIKVIHCTVNGKVREIAVDERESLTDMLPPAAWSDQREKRL